MSFLSNHHHSPDYQENNNPFLIPFLLTLAFSIVEFVGGIWTQSLALLSDSWHMISDVLALGLAMVAAHRNNKALLDNRQNKSELIVSTINVVLMLMVIAWILIEAFERFGSPRPIASSYVMLIAFIGLAVNVFVVKLLHQHKGEKGLNHQAALLHVIGDVMGSLAALLSGLIIYLTGWLQIDAALSMLIALLLLAGTVSLIRNIWLDVQRKKTVLDQNHRQNPSHKDFE